MIHDWYTTQWIVLRLNGVNGVRTYSATATLDGHIQPVDDETTAKMYASYEATHIGYCDVDESIEVNDKIDIGDDYYYLVVNINQINWDFAINTMKEVILKRQKKD